MSRWLRRRRTRLAALLAVLMAGLLGGAVLGVVVGPAGESAGAALDAVTTGLRALLSGQALPADSLTTIVWNIRLPRVILGCLVGASLAVAGAVMQALFQNPMADPYIVGVSSGAALGAVAAMMLGITLNVAGYGATPVLSFLGAIGVTALVYALSQRGGRVQTATLLLTGIAVGSLAGSLTSFLMLSNDSLSPVVLSWMLGSLAGRDWTHVAALAPQAVIGCAAAGLMARPLNVLLLGDEAALNVGLDVHRTKRWLLALASLLAAGAVSVSGVIGFVGLVIPHVCRLLVGPDHRVLVPVSAVAGALLLVLADVAARMVLAPVELPIGIITSTLGCPFFLYLLHRHGHRRL